MPDSPVPIPDPSDVAPRSDSSDAGGAIDLADDSPTEAKSTSAVRTAVAGIAMVVLAVAVLWWLSPRMDAQTLVVYCAHDAEFAEPILRDFERETGITLAIRYDTEANKSLGLVNRIVSERDQPQCDVFWNNELLGTLELAREGLLEPYIGTGHRRIPPQYRDEEGLWTGFAARLRMYIVNPQVLAADESAIRDRLDSADLSRVTIAKPMFGTTLTQYCLWWSVWGGEETISRQREWQRRGLKLADGNAMTKNLVAGGACDLGFTDTDDYFGALDAGRPVAGLPVRVEGKTICIPNTVAIVKGSTHTEAAQSLIDFLLSAETELALARSASRQIPLGDVDEAQLPAEVRPLRTWASESADLRPLISIRNDVLNWLRGEYVP